MEKVLLKVQRAKQSKITRIKRKTTKKNTHRETTTKETDDKSVRQILSSIYGLDCMFDFVIENTSDEKWNGRQREEMDQAKARANCENDLLLYCRHKVRINSI